MESEAFLHMPESTRTEAEITLVKNWIEPNVVTRFMSQAWG